MRRLRHAAVWVFRCGLLVPLFGLTSAGDVQFTDIAQSIGVDFKHESSATSNKYLIETMG